MYRLCYEKRVFKDLDKIPNNFVEKIITAVKELSRNPLPRLSKKLSGKENVYRLRAGDYRIIYRVAHQAKEIAIILIRHRRDVYRSL